MTELYAKIATIGRKYGADKIILFGSRARGDNRERSDIDLAVYGVPTDRQGAFWADIDDLPTLLDFDIVHVDDRTDRKLVVNIEKDGIIIMSKMQEKYNKLVQAVDRLREAIDDYQRTPLDSIRDGAIQRFEFCVELTWKTLREYLIDQGYTDINSPKSVMRHAYADGLVDNEQAWIDLLNDRNLTSHIYDEATAARIYDLIVSRYCPMFAAVIDKLSQK